MQQDVSYTHNDTRTTSSFCFGGSGVCLTEHSSIILNCTRDVFRYRCYHDCGAHGTCNMQTYACDCDLGWLGDNCTVDCGCHGHSWCPNGIGVCDNCQGTFNFVIPTLLPLLVVFKDQGNAFKFSLRYWSSGRAGSKPQLTEPNQITLGSNLSEDWTWVERTTVGSSVSDYTRLFHIHEFCWRHDVSVVVRRIPRFEQKSRSCWR